MLSILKLDGGLNRRYGGGVLVPDAACCVRVFSGKPHLGRWGFSFLESASWCCRRGLQIKFHLRAVVGGFDSVEAFDDQHPKDVGGRESVLGKLDIQLRTVRIDTSSELQVQPKHRPSNHAAIAHGGRPSGAAAFRLGRRLKW